MRYQNAFYFFDQPPNVSDLRMVYDLTTEDGAKEFIGIWKFVVDVTNLQMSPQLLFLQPRSRETQTFSRNIKTIDIETLARKVHGVSTGTAPQIQDSLYRALSEKCRDTGNVLLDFNEYLALSFESLIPLLHADHDSQN
jgi:hypothetical protein